MAARRSRFVSPEVAEVLHRQEGRPPAPWARYSAPLTVHFPAADTPREIAHELQQVPDGYLVILSVGGTVQAENPINWTDQLAVLRASQNNTVARVIFVTTREEPHDA